MILDGRCVETVMVRIMFDVASVDRDMQELCSQ